MPEWVAESGYGCVTAFLAALRRREEKAWKFVLGDWRSRLAAVFRYRTDVDDILAEAVRKFWEAVSRRAVRADLDVRGYFITIGVRCASDLRRRRLHLEGVDPAELSWPAGPDDEFAQSAERAALVWQAFHTLSAGERLVVMHRVVGELPYAEIALAAGTTAGHCRVTYLRAMRKLQSCLSGWGVPLSARIRIRQSAAD